MYSKTLGEQMWKLLSKGQAGTQFFFLALERYCLIIFDSA